MKVTVLKNSTSAPAPHLFASIWEYKNFVIQYTIQDYIMIFLFKLEADCIITNSTISVSGKVV
jgi:hypothetical protein